MAGLLLIVGAVTVLAALLFSLGWSRAARFRAQRGKAPWAINPVGWGAVYALLLPVGWLLYSLASRTTRVVDSSLVNRADSVIADTPEERERMRRIASELPLLRPPEANARGWHLDPLRQRRFRFYDGRHWTREVSDDPARRMAAAVGDATADMRRRLLSLPPPSQTGASWHIDPLGTYHFRYYDGREWTEEVRKTRS